MGLPEKAAKGLHAAAFELFRKHVRPGAKVLDLGSGAGAWAKRLFDASYSVTACDLEAPTEATEFPYRAVDLNQNFGEMFGNEQFDAVSIVEVIEHLENPRHIFRQIKSLLKRGGVVLLTTPNASGLYSRLRFFFTGQMAMFTDAAYAIGHGHITPLTAWQLEKIFSENGMKALERRFHDAPFFPPRSSGDIAKVIAWLAFRPFMFGTVGGQIILYAVKNEN
jgi:2-polyprenyl-3-methyl-5-hydroxy-6-metoxy-1,4-benzoquinol methylase